MPIVSSTFSGGSNITVNCCGCDDGIETFTCPTGLNALDVVYSSGINTVDQAIGNDVLKKFSIGFAKTKPSSTTVTIVKIGKLIGFSGLTAGLPVFLSDSVLGGITQAPPSGAGKWLQIIGMATAPDTISIQLSPPIKRT